MPRAQGHRLQPLVQMQKATVYCMHPPRAFTDMKRLVGRHSTTIQPDKRLILTAIPINPTSFKKVPGKLVMVQTPKSSSVGVIDS